MDRLSVSLRFNKKDLQALPPGILDSLAVPYRNELKALPEKSTDGTVTPIRYRARFIEPGVISYEDVGQGLVMVGRKALDRMLPSFVGKPVFNFVHKEIEADQAFDFENVKSEEMADGIVSAVGTGEDGWDWADMMIWDEETQRNIDEYGFEVSCAYDTIESGPPGKHNGIKFDEEVLDGKYVHMAIVDNPRYEGSTVYRNAKGVTTVADKAKKGFTLFWKKNAEEPPKEPPKKEEPPKEPEKENAEEGLQADEGAYMVIDGQKVPLQELVETYMGKQNAGEGQAIAPEDEITLPDGSKCTGADLLKAYQGNGGAKVGNEGGGEPMPGGAGEKETLRTNSEGGKKEDPNEHFLAVKKNAAKAPDEPAPVAPQTKTDRYAAGKERYGSAVPGGK